MDREAIARVVRRRQVQELLEFEREREETLRDQIELVAGEAGSPAVDAAVFAHLSPEHVQIVKQELSPHVYDTQDSEEVDDFFGWERDEIVDDEPWLSDEERIDPTAEELARLNAELENCRLRQAAFAAYLEALDR